MRGRGAAGRRGAGPRQVRRLGERVDEQVLPLGRGERTRRTAVRCPSVPGASGAGSTPGAATCTRSAVEPVLRDDPPARPRAGGHDRGGRAQDLPLARRQLRATRRCPARRRAAGAPARPARAGGPPGRRRPGPRTRPARRPAPRRRPVPPRERLANASRAAASGLRPSAGDRALVHHPAVVGQSRRRRAGRSALPPLGDGGVVDVAGHHDVHLGAGRASTGWSQVTLVARPGDVRLVQRHGDPGEAAGARRRARPRAPGRRAGRRSPWRGTRWRC